MVVNSGFPVKNAVILIFLIQNRKRLNLEPEDLHSIFIFLKIFKILYHPVNPV